jgi:hypothetical protein
MCRWLERDPAGYQDGPSLYSYLGRNPMAGTDPYGLALHSVSGKSKAGEAIKARLVEIDRNKAMARGVNGSMCRHPLGSDAQFADDMRINPDRLEGVREVAGGIRTGIEATASVLPGGGFATAVNEASKGNFGEAALNVVPGEKLAVLGLSVWLSKTVVAKFAAVDPNKLRHIFGAAEHRLGPLVDLIGSEAAAYAEIEAAAQSANTLGKLTRVDGHLEGVVNVRGVEVTVRGVVVDGAFRLGTAFR